MCAKYREFYTKHNEKIPYILLHCSSETKYDSNTGWPSFTAAIGTDGENDEHTNILKVTDTSHGMMRTEVICKKVSHL